MTYPKEVENTEEGENVMSCADFSNPTRSFFSIGGRKFCVNVPIAGELRDATRYVIERRLYDFNKGEVK